MKSRLLLVTTLTFAVAGCLFDAPLLPGKAEPTDPRVVGAWRCVSPRDEEPMELRITVLPQQRYGVLFSAKDENPSMFGAQAVKLDGQVLLNVQEVKDSGDGKWTVGRYKLLSPDVLQIESAQEEGFKGATTTAARLDILKQAAKTDNGAFGPFCTCIRVAPEKK